MAGLDALIDKSLHRIKLFHVFQSISIFAYFICQSVRQNYQYPEQELQKFSFQSINSIHSYNAIFHKCHTRDI